MAKEIVTTISPDGDTVTVEAKGYKGKGCHQAVDFFMPNSKTNRVTSQKPEFQEKVSAQTEKEKLNVKA